jgi:hypothetical protein
MRHTYACVDVHTYACVDVLRPIQTAERERQVGRTAQMAANTAGGTLPMG